jgi:hypothetical protein
MVSSAAHTNSLLRARAESHHHAFGNGDAHGDRRGHERELDRVKRGLVVERIVARPIRAKLTQLVHASGRREPSRCGAGGAHPRHAQRWPPPHLCLHRLGDRVRARRTTRIIRHINHKLEWCERAASAWGYDVCVDFLGQPKVLDP